MKSAVLGMARLFALAVTILIGLAPAQTALAHASLISSQPEDGAVLSASPARVILIFNEPVAPLRMQVIDRRGEATQLTDIVQHNNSVILRMPGTLDQGTHALSWRVVSSDGHPIGGTLIFSVGQPDANPPALQTKGGQALRTAIWAVRVAILHRAVLRPRRRGLCQLDRNAAAAGPDGKADRRIMRRRLGAAAGGGRPARTRRARHAAVRARECARYGRRASARPMERPLLSPSLLARWRCFPCEVARRPPRACSPLAALVGIGFALAASGHAAAASPQWLTRPAVWIHVVAVAAWIGSLWPLLRLLHGDPVSGRCARSAVSQTSFPGSLRLDRLGHCAGGRPALARGCAMDHELRPDPVDEAGRGRGLAGACGRQPLCPRTQGGSRRCRSRAAVSAARSRRKSRSRC